ncbi:transmembrane protease serine 9-like, partial [Aplochiton taeniatus]
MTYRTFERPGQSMEEENGTEKGGNSQSDVCGKALFNTKQNRIVGGQDATPGSWPWQASLHNAVGHFCGGSLINNLWILTAAHCFSSTSTAGYTVYLGRQDQQGANLNQQSRSLAMVLRHPDYNATTNDNDIALLQLSSAVGFTDYIKPVCLAEPGSSFYTDLNTWVTGWGKIGSGVPLPSPQTLQEVSMPVVGNRKCNCLYGVGSIRDNMICAGLLAGGKDSCQGDFGGPLVIQQGQVWIQAGIVSFGIGCALPNFPGVYTRVSQYQTWINTQIKSNLPGYFCYSSTGVNICGIALFNTKQNRIVGGQDANPGSWPWQASLHNNGAHFCGGSLINNLWILTAAHCFSSTSTAGYTVYLGRQDQEGANLNQQSRSLAMVLRHPDYNAQTSDNDIALLQLSSAVGFTDYIKPVCLAEPGSSFYTDLNTWVTGWGRIGSGVPLPSPQTLQEVSVPVVGNRKCNCLYGVGTITDNMICAGLLAGGKDSCQGDSGGPLVIKQGQVWLQAGIVSFGRGCALPNYPGVYTRVSQYQTWINTQIASNPPGYVSYASTGVNSDLSVTCPGLPAVVTPSPTSAGALSATAPPTVGSVCGKALLNTKQDRIVGGQNATAGSWPWQASLHNAVGHFCGGSLINNLWILTAAHCFSSTSISGYTVYLGRQDQEGANLNQQSRSLAMVLRHPDYNAQTSDNDIALLQLSSAVGFTDYIKPVCLAEPGSSFYTDLNTWVTGWGRIGSGVPLPSPQTLQEVSVPVVGNKKCNCLYGEGKITDNMICAGLLAGGKDSCQGDSGGPLVIQQSQVWIQVGIVSFGIGCALPDYPGVYTRVSQYQTWINTQIKSNL